MYATLVLPGFSSQHTLRQSPLSIANLQEKDLNFLNRSRFGLSFVLLITSITAQAGVQYFPKGNNLPFSEAVQVDNVLYLSGELGVMPGTLTLAKGGFEGEARQTMDNIGATLKKHGLGFDSVVKCTVMLAEMSDWPAFNKIYASYFDQDKLPARSAFGGVQLGLNAKLEVECWAYNPIK